MEFIGAVAYMFMVIALRTMKRLISATRLHTYDQQLLVTAETVRCQLREDLGKVERRDPCDVCVFRNGNSRAATGPRDMRDTLNIRKRQTHSFSHSFSRVHLIIIIPLGKLNALASGDVEIQVSREILLPVTDH